MTLPLPAPFPFPPRAVVIHGGQHKTGSTAIQNVLDGQREALREAGWLYPESGLRRDPTVGNRHYWLMDAVRLGKPPGTGEWGELRREVADWRGRVLISHENFFAVRMQPGRIVRELGHRRLYMMAYLRHPVDYVESCYREWVRRVGFEGSVREFYATRHEWLDVARVVDLWDEVLGPGHVVLRPYAGGSTVQDFLALCGLSALPVGEVEGNRSLSTRQVLVHRIGNRLGIPVHKRDAVAALLDGPQAPELEAVFKGPACRALRSGHVPNARVVDDALCDEIEATWLPSCHAALARCGVDPLALGTTRLRERPVDDRFDDPALHDAITRVLRRRLVADNASSPTPAEKERT